jgi:hypothetical protein
VGETRPKAIYLKATTSREVTGKGALYRALVMAISGVTSAPSTMEQYIGRKGMSVSRDEQRPGVCVCVCVCVEKGTASSTAHDLIARALLLVLLALGQVLFAHHLEQVLV